MHHDITSGWGGWFGLGSTLMVKCSLINLLQLQVIFYEQDWNPQVDKQALQRAHRIGQMNHVLSINLVTARTVEEVSNYALDFTPKMHII